MSERKKKALLLRDSRTLKVKCATSFVKDSGCISVQVLVVAVACLKYQRKIKRPT